MFIVFHILNNFVIVENLVVSINLLLYLSFSYNTTVWYVTNTSHKGLSNLISSWWDQIGHTDGATLIMIDYILSLLIFILYYGTNIQKKWGARKYKNPQWRGCWTDSKKSNYWERLESTTSFLRTRCCLWNIK